MITSSQHAYEVRPRKDKRGVDLISDVLPLGRLRYTEIPHTIGYAQFYSRSHDAVIPVYDESGNVIDTHEHVGDFNLVSSELRAQIVSDCEGQDSRGLNLARCS